MEGIKQKDLYTELNFFTINLFNLLLGGYIMEMSRPLDTLNEARNKRVIVELKNGKQFVGVLKAFDIHINTVLDDSEERVDGEQKRKLGTIFLRGDTIILISLAD